MIEHQKSQHEDEIKRLKESNNTKDYVKTNCKECNETCTINKMRVHTKQKHRMTISEYKEKHKRNENEKQFYDLIEIVLHRCGFCGEYLLLESDAIAEHLRRRSNKETHENITHGKYNEKFLKTCYGTSKAMVAIKYEGELDDFIAGPAAKKSRPPGPPGPSEDISAGITEQLKDVAAQSLGSSLQPSSSAGKGSGRTISPPVERLVQEYIDVFKNRYSISGDISINASKAGIQSPSRPETESIDKQENERMDEDTDQFLEQFFEDENRDQEVDQSNQSEDEDIDQRRNVEIENSKEKKKADDDDFINELLESSEDEDDGDLDKSPVVSTEKVTETKSEEKDFEARKKNPPDNVPMEEDQDASLESEESLVNHMVEDHSDSEEEEIVETETETESEVKDFLSPNERTAEFHEYLQALSVDPEDFKPLIGLLSVDFDNPESIPQFFEQFSHFGI